MTPDRTPAFIAVKQVVQGQASKLRQIPNLAIRLHQDWESFNAIREHFVQIRDLEGRTMEEVAREYWKRKKKERRA